MFPDRETAGGQSSCDGQGTGKCIKQMRLWKNKYYFFMEISICIIPFMDGI